MTRLTKKPLSTLVLVTSMCFVTCCFRVAPEYPRRFLEGSCKIIMFPSLFLHYIFSLKKA